MNSYCNSLERLVDRLGNVGFAQVGAARFTNHEYRLDLGQPWSTFSVRCTSRRCDPLSGQLGTPGPWKRISRGATCRLVADVPTTTFRDDFNRDAAEEERSSLAKLVEWVLHTSMAGKFEAWQPPDADEIELWSGPEKLTVVAGPHVRQGTLLRGPGQLAVRIPIVPAIPPQLPRARMNWLRSVLVDTQNRHRAVRIGLAGEPPQQSAIAEIDLSGAPAGALPTLFTASLAALKHAVEWSIQPLGFLVDLSLDCRALEVRPHPEA